MNLTTESLNAPPPEKATAIIIGDKEMLRDKVKVEWM